MKFPETAFDIFKEHLEWNSVRGERGTFAASVFHGQSQNESAGPSRGAIAADPWSVMVDADDAVVMKIRPGDKVIRLDSFDQRLNVQQVVRDPDLGWILICTANERSPK